LPGPGRQVAATCTGRILKIPDSVLFQPVKKDQTLVVMDTVVDNEQVNEAKLRAELAAAGAEVEYLSAQLIPTQQQLRVETASLQNNRQDNWRRFEVDVDRPNCASSICRPPSPPTASLSMTWPCR
jgi:multidrug resistance efflux pump